MKTKKLPEWYWSRGLHDAKIVSVEVKESDWNPKDNYLIFRINGHGAMFEQDIKEIRFYEFRFSKIEFDINSLNGAWWLHDEITEKSGEYHLLLEFDDKNCERETIKIIFKTAEVIRRK